MGWNSPRDNAFINAIKDGKITFPDGITCRIKGPTYDVVIKLPRDNVRQIMDYGDEALKRKGITFEVISDPLEVGAHIPDGASGSNDQPSMTQQEAPSSLDTQPMTVLLPMNPHVNADMLRNGDHG